MEEEIPRGQIVSGDGAVLVSLHIGDRHQQAIPGAVNYDSERRVIPEGGISDDRNLLQNGGVSVSVEGDHADASLEVGDDEAAVEMVPLGALTEPRFAGVGVDVSSAVGRLGVDDVGEGDGGEEKEEEQESGGAQCHG